MAAAVTATSLLEGVVPRGLRAERNEALHRVLRRLPRDYIGALIKGLDEADVIEPGRLFAGRHGGCVVGVTLRALDPSYQGRRLVWGRRTRRSIGELKRSLARRVPHLYALEQIFDRTFVLAQQRSPWAPRQWLARRVATWIADEARTELLLREMSSEWLDSAVAEITSAAETRLGPGAPFELLPA